MRNGILVALCAAFVLVSAPALADDDRRGPGRGEWQHGHDHKHDKRHGDKHHYKRHGEWRGPSGWHRGHGRAVVIWQGHRHWAPPPRRHHHHYKPRPPRHFHHHSYKHRDRDDWALYAILALQLVDAMSESQQQSYAWAQQRAVAAPVGETIEWEDGGLYGSVTPVRDGADRSGRYCREFQHQITVGNRLQSGYGIACRQPDGAWEIVS